HGGADGDFLEAAAGASADGEAGADNCPGAAAKTSCPGTATAVAARNTGAVSVGISAPGATGTTQLYLVGSSADDVVAVTYSAASVEFQLSSGQFDQSAEDEGGCAVTMTVATCPLTGPLDSIVLAGMGADDGITASGFPSTAGVVVTGGQGNDTITGGDLSEDVLADGPGSGDDDLSGLDRDDALLHNGGPDRLFGGAGNDLFLSVSICDQEALSGEAGRDNSSWARLGAEGVSAQLDPGRAGEVGVGGTPACPANAFDSLQGIEDLEGSNQPDVFFGDAERNQLLGHKGADSYFAGAGDDSILANSADDDTAIDCGDGVDSALIDLRPQFNDPVPVNCESVREAEPNNFRTVTELPPPPLPEPPPADLTPPRTRITHRPPKLVIARDLPRRVSFRFASSEPGSSFRCKLDRRPFGVCTPPRVFNLGRGRHAVRIFAVDAAGNRDPSPALFRFEVRRAKPASARG
ncbi:MAG: hypothetical protein JJE35_09540, partial [Thermoleophilia bacterium]|nr:hypothetical protein [Thermoleophilia bacterium]